MSEIVEKKRRGRTVGSLKRHPERLIDLVVYVDLSREEHLRSKGSRLSVKLACERLGSFLWINAADPSGCEPAHYVRAFKNDENRLIVNNKLGKFAVADLIQGADSVRRRYAQGLRFVRDQGLQDTVRDRLDDLLGKERSRTEWNSPWVLPTPLLN